ncbi:MAG: sigma-70 family RNA polymerase sigma factor [Kiritimatiellae bacterium]|nr:sigma-70 family RNA polymerase sigma factor [Kiritimatiellia bacterium]
MMSAFPETPCTLLVKLAAEMTERSDEFAWQRFFELYQPAIVKFAESQGAAADSEDIAQKILLKLVDVLRAGRYSGEAGHFRSYLATLIRREVIDFWRAAKARGGGRMVSLDNDDAAVEPAVESETVALIDAKWRLARHEAAVEHVLTRTMLPAKTKAIFRAYAVDEEPMKSVAARFGVSEDVVYQTKSRVARMVAAIESEMDG